MYCPYYERKILPEKQVDMLDWIRKITPAKESRRKGARTVLTQSPVLLEVKDTTWIIPEKSEVVLYEQPKNPRSPVTLAAVYPKGEGCQISILSDGKTKLRTLDGKKSNPCGSRRAPRGGSLRDRS